MALLMNLLTVAVSAGLLVLLFQDGHLSSLLSFTPLGGLEGSNLVLLFVVAFALSTDYGVFLYARIKEGHDHGLSTRAAVAHGLLVPALMGRLGELCWWAPIHLRRLHAWVGLSEGLSEGPLREGEQRLGGARA